MIKTFYIAGFQHHEGQTVLPRMSKGDVLVMRPEPDNKYDKNAIKLKFEGVMIGYIPAKVAKEINNITILTHVCETINLNLESDPWTTVQVELRPL